MEKQTVYLAGGFHSDWRQVVKKLKNVQFFDPCEKEKSRKWEKEEYATWDLNRIMSSGVLFAYLEANNPSGVGLAAEIGYAMALQKTIILVIEPGNERERFFEILKPMASVVYTKLDDGIDFLSYF